jgi:hypothetical protein
MRRTAMCLALLFASFSFTAVAEARHNGRHLRAVRAPVQPDQVIQWNQTLLSVIGAPGAQPATVHPTRTMAITQLAVFDAVSAIEHTDRSYLPRLHAPHSASADAAVAAAAHDALIALLPNQKPTIDAKLQASLAQIGAGEHVREGIRVGEQAAAQILEARANDGAADAPPVFVPQTGPGEYQLTPPNFQQPVFTHWGMVQPVAREAGDQFRPAPPPAVTSPRYATDFKEVKSLGEINSTVRSVDQTDIGRFWGAAPVQNVWNQIAQIAGMSSRNTLEQNARMFAVLDASVADGVIALYDSKYAYHRWRPVTAVRAASSDGNPDTTGDPNWTPLAATALDPSYAGAHATISQSAAAALRDFFGSDRLDFSLTTPSLPGIERSFQGFSQASDEAAVSRIYAGQHFRYDEDAGRALGDQVGDFVFERILGRAGRPEPSDGPHPPRHRGHGREFRAVA